ncbi:heat shock 70 kDa protein 13-like [Watersipora subatra]|uniref:heat shock 70 kDa protein 13-like n=1 Tax=Watersipora subatra TaxID=2589382 RepID=UPI00355B5EB8
MGSSAITLLGGALIALLFAGYFAQRSLPPPAPKVVGIDLGTTYSCIGGYQSVTGEVIIYEDEEKHKCIPSVVAFTETEILVGHKAVAQHESNPYNTIYDAKRFIGKQFTKEQLDAEAPRYQFKMTLDNEGFVQFHVTHQGKALVVDPIAVGGYIAKTLKDTMERNLTIYSPNLCVVSVPAEFNQLQRNCTAKALATAGFKVLRVINEPTAAALAYGLHTKKGVSTVLVVDLGGGTLDVSLLLVQGGMFLTQAMAGNNHLGGQDFNNQLQNYILKDIQNHYHEALTEPGDLQLLRAAIETAKLNLTLHDATILTLPLASLGNKTYTHKVTREEFERINEPLFEKILEPVGAVLEYTELERSEVDEIVMVGGSTRIPAVRRLVSHYFNKSLNTAVDADLAVVSGVSIQAGIIGGMWPLMVSAVEVQTSVKKIVFN